MERYTNPSSHPANGDAMKQIFGLMIRNVTALNTVECHTNLSSLLMQPKGRCEAVKKVWFLPNATSSPIPAPIVVSVVQGLEHQIVALEV